MTHEQIQKKAYERYEWRKRNNMPGNEKGDWSWAEFEVLNEQEQEPYFHYPRGKDGAQ